MRHAAIAQALLPLAVTLAPARCALIPAPRFALATPVAQLSTARATVALPAVVTDAHSEWLIAVEAGDLDEVELVRAGHAAGKADLDNSRGEWEALFRHAAELPPRCVDCLAVLPGAAGRFHLAARERTSRIDPRAFRSLRSLRHCAGAPGGCAGPAGNLARLLATSLPAVARTLVRLRRSSLRLPPPPGWLYEPGGKEGDGFRENSRRSATGG